MLAVVLSKSERKKAVELHRTLGVRIKQLEDKLLRELLKSPAYGNKITEINGTIDILENRRKYLEIAAKIR